MQIQLPFNPWDIFVGVVQQVPVYLGVIWNAIPWPMQVILVILALVALIAPKAPRRQARGRSRWR